MKDLIEFLKNEGILETEIGIIAGSGWSKIEDFIAIKKRLKYSEIKGFPISKVKGHKGELVYGTISKRNVILFSGRFHYYEGYSMKEITLPVKILKELQGKILVVTNAAGGLNPSFDIGDLMIITDHINLFPENPLRGDPTFPSMLDAYDIKIIEEIERIATKKNISIKKGVYVGWQGPSLETKAEYRFLRIIGADAVGLSTVPEVIMAKALGLKVIGFSAITNMGLGEKIKDVTHDEVLKVAEECAKKAGEILKEWLEEYFF
ncbi:MAG: purine-nucleoside phosphorylase [Candidatus Hydrothermales bacterium]